MAEYQKEHIVRLRRDGLGYSKIATILSLSENTIKSHCKGHNVPAIESSAKHDSQKVTADGICKKCGKPIEQ